MIKYLTFAIAFAGALLPMFIPSDHVSAYSEVRCSFCHADEYYQLDSSPSHKSWGDPERADSEDCRTCHAVKFRKPFEEAIAPHSTISMECVDCHAYAHLSVASCEFCHIPGPKAQRVGRRRTVISIDAAPGGDGKWSVGLSVERVEWAERMGSN